MSKPSRDTITQNRAEKPVPIELYAFVRKTAGPTRLSRFCGWDHAESHVWELWTAAGETLYLKQHRQARKFRQEHHAYTAWVPALPRVTPTLVGARQGEPYALLMTAVPGTLAERVPLSHAHEVKLHRQAGSFLHALHGLPYEDADPVSLADAFVQRMAAWLPRVQEIVDRHDVDWVVARMHETLPLLESYRRVPCHRDYSPRNWIVNQQERLELYVIDFEHSRPDLALLDMERLWAGPWHTRPDLKDAFFEGYGRGLSDDEEQVLERLAALGALTTIGWAHEHGDAPFEQYGRELLARLQR
jgi:Ser/Thr protein kinase RdoA (MazF antagonist)